MYTKFDIRVNRIVYLIKKAKKILLVGHKKPDSDTLGSLCAFSLFLKKFKKEVILANQEPPPPSLQFLPEAKEIVTFEKIEEKLSGVDLIFTFDCGDFRLTGLNELSGFGADVSLINIDHHHDSKLFGAINIVDGLASSTSEIVYLILQKLGVAIDKETATCLLCGIFGDTDSFKNPNTSEKTLRITSDLLSSGANLKEIVRFTLSGKSVSTLRLWGGILSRIKKHEGFGIVTTVVTHHDMKENGASFSDLEGVANFLNSVPEARASIVISERRGGEIKASLRTLSEKIDVSRLAHLFGGGGHKKAAGFTIPGKLVRENGRWRII